MGAPVGVEVGWCEGSRARGLRASGGARAVEQAVDHVVPGPAAGLSSPTASKSRKPSPTAWAKCTMASVSRSRSTRPASFEESTSDRSRFGPVDQVLAQHGLHLRVAAGGHEGLEQDGLARARVAGDQVGADGGQHVGDVALEAVLGEEPIELAAGAGLRMASASSSALPEKRL